jgi:lipoyl(octanoyl) transferase
MSRVVHVKWLGQKSFLEALNIQNITARKLLDGLQGQPITGVDTIILTEHTPVYTVGIRTAPYPESEEMKLRAMGADFVRTNRGGLITFHGPGQLVAYPILYLGNYKKSMRWYISQVEQTVITMCEYFGLCASRSEHTGVWISDRKVAAIGVHGSKFVTTHGTAINCNTDLGWFSCIDPCGIPDKEVTSLSRELQRNVTVEETIPLFLKAFGREFDCTLKFESELNVKAVT